METLWQDLRYGLRTLWKNRAFTMIAVFALALGIGANSAIFTVVNAVLLRPLPYSESERLMLLSERSPQLEGMSISYQNFTDWRAQNSVFEQIALFRRQGYNLTGINEPERLNGSEVSAELFTALRVKPALGRVFTAEEDKPGATPVVVLGHALWSRRFGGNAAIIGQNITMNGKSFNVIGVMPADYQFPSRVDLWTPVGQVSDNPNWTRGNHPGLYAVARLKSGVSLEQARVEMDTIALRLEQQYPETNSGNRVSVKSLYEEIVGDIRPILLVLLAAVAAVLLIACANVANLLLARAASRQKEIAIRSAMGANRWRIIQQLLTESLMLSLLGGGLGLLLAIWGTKFLLSLSEPGTIPRFQEIQINGSVFGFTLLISLLTGIIFGIAPAWQATKIDLIESLRDTSRSATASMRSQRLRSTLVVSEIAIALVLLIGAGLLLKSFFRLQQVDPGFNPENVLTMGISLPTTKYKEEADRRNFFQQLLPRIAALPGVSATAIASELPFDSGNQTSFFIDGAPPPPPGQAPLTEYAIVSPDYFQAMGLRLLKGRTFTDQDRADSEKVVVIDENFANRHWPNQDPIGKRIRNGGDQAPPQTVIGVVGNVKFEGLDVLEHRVMSYRCYAQVSNSGQYLVVHAQNNPALLTGAIRNEIAGLDKDQPVYNIRTMNELYDSTIASRRLSILLLGIFAVVAVILASVGIYGVMSYTVTQRTQEIGIRMALGAQVRDVLGLVLRQGMLLALIGVGIGVVGALLLSRLISGLLFGISATDPMTFITISVILTLVTLLACYIPARRATKVDPMIALRCE